MTTLERFLGVDAEAIESIIERKWEIWAEKKPALEMFDAQRLRESVDAADAEPKNQLFKALAALAAKGVGDDTEAAALLAWLLLPAAKKIVAEAGAARRTSGAKRAIYEDHPIAELVAAELFCECRLVGRRNAERVAATIAGQVRTKVLLAIGHVPAMKAHNTGMGELGVDVQGDMGERLNNLSGASAGLSAREELGEVLESAVADQVIDTEECRTLQALAQVCSQLPSRQLSGATPWGQAAAQALAKAQPGRSAYAIRRQALGAIGKLSRAAQLGAGAGMAIS
ncbi:MAG: hypothetical protein LBR21_06370 [Propionibacteriaceae bacterium]|jgi:hypothetical protein|nr:hypothetical protein [Propionibacteriaceae bacterium]